MVKTPGQTPKSAKMAKKKPVGLNSETPVKMKTPDKPIKMEKLKTPKEEKFVVSPKKINPVPSPKVGKDGLNKNGAKSNERLQGGFSGGRGGGEGGVFRPGSPRGRGGFAGGRGRGGFAGGRGRGFYGPRQVDPKGVFCSFEESINADAARAILKLAADAKSICFGRGVVMHFETEEKAREIGMKAANMDFCGITPTTVSKAFARPPPMKRELPDNTDTGDSKKQKVESKVTQEFQDDDEEDSDEEEDEDDDEEDEDDDEEDEDDDDEEDDDDDDEDDDDDDE